MNKIAFLFTFTLSFCIATGHHATAQDADADSKKKAAKPEKSSNLVDNGSFETFEGSLRRKEQLELATGWVNPTESKSELYSSEVKSRYVAAPENMYGIEEPAEGSNYAGLVTYSPRSKVPRSYLQTELTEAMKEKGLYCVKFKASLAERSRYAANNMTVSLDKSKLSAKGMGALSSSSTLFTEYNEVVDTRDGWWEFCALYRATGKEKFLTIGNFDSDDRTNSVLMDLPEKYTEEGSHNAAYYFIDDVSVVGIAVGESCNCAHERIPESKIIFSGSTAITDEMTPAEQLQALDVYFYQYQSTVVSASETTINKVIDILVANPSVKVTVIGHSDSEEVALAEKENQLRGLAQKRANLVKTYMVNQGIDEERIVVKSMDNKASTSAGTTPVALAKNRRVEFEAK